MLGTKGIGVDFVLLQLLVAETTGIGTGGIHIVTLVGKTHHGVGGVETTREGYYYFFLCHVIGVWGGTSCHLEMIILYIVIVCVFDRWLWRAVQLLDALKHL